MGKAKRDVLQGTLDLLILKVLGEEPLHGWGVAKRIQQASREVLHINQGSLYPALYRLQDRGLVRARWDEPGDGRPVKVYKLTARGRRELEAEREHWMMMSTAVNEVLQSG